MSSEIRQKTGYFGDNRGQFGDTSGTVGDNLGTFAGHLRDNRGQFAWLLHIQAKYAILRLGHGWNNGDGLIDCSGLEQGGNSVRLLSERVSWAVWRMREIAPVLHGKTSKPGAEAVSVLHRLHRVRGRKLSGQ
jgi:hypothetical protein